MTARIDTGRGAWDAAAVPRAVLTKPAVIAWLDPHETAFTDVIDLETNARPTSRPTAVGSGWRP